MKDFMKDLGLDDVSSGAYAARHATNGNPTETTGSGYWLGSDGDSTEYITLDLGQARDVNTVALRNTHNGTGNDRGTRKFRLWASNSVDGSNQLINPELILNGTLSAQYGSQTTDSWLASDF